jgi:hypothetical protein
MEKVNDVNQPDTSRLPAGSTLVVGGVHVPHPHAAPNGPGQGDPRAGDTDAVTEEITVDPESGDLVVNQRPLDNEVKPLVGIDLAAKVDLSSADIEAAEKAKADQAAGENK